MLANLLRDESGATAIEYGLIAALVSVAAITALTAMGSSLNDLFGVVSNELTAAAEQAEGAGESPPP
jgi:pilus assembly protein Flp/PilA